MLVTASAVLLIGTAAAAGGARAATAPTAPTGGPTGPFATSSPAVSIIAAGSSYVALGDSYSAGAGLTPSKAGSPPQCLRSTRNYASVVASRLSLALADVTCSGATTADLTAPQAATVPAQLDAVGASTALVTMTLGGNDGGLFGDFVGTCSAAADSTGGTGSPCRDRNGGRFDAIIDAQVHPNLVRALLAVRQKAPRATVLVIGYPHILPGSVGCYPVMPFASGDVAYLSRIERHLDTVMAQAAAETGATYVDTWVASHGHDACAPLATRWIEPVIGSTTSMTVHPNLRGEQGFARQVLKALGG